MTDKDKKRGLKKREGGEKTTYIPHKLKIDLETKSQKKKKENHNRHMECFAAVVAEDTGLVYNLRSTCVPRSVTQNNTAYIQRQADRQTD